MKEGEQSQLVVEENEEGKRDMVSSHFFDDRITVIGD